MQASFNLPIHFFRHGAFYNLGDELAPYIIEKLTGLSTEKVDISSHDNAIFSVGSILAEACNSNHAIWGSGLISAQARPKIYPQIFAVRGPLTARLLEIPNKVALGDPALLMPDLFCPNHTEKKYKLGIIPHYIDQKSFVSRFDDEGEKSFVILNIASKNIEDFISVLLQCDFVISSSLHGVILAQAYQIPAVWVEFSDSVIGNGFKFHDYFQSIGVAPYKPVRFVDGKIYFKMLLTLRQKHLGQLYINNFNKDDLYSSLDEMLKLYRN